MSMTECQNIIFEICFKNQMLMKNRIILLFDKDTIITAIDRWLH